MLPRRTTRDGNYNILKIEPVRACMPRVCTSLTPVSLLLCGAGGDDGASDL